MFATAFVLLYVAHLVADYALQTDHMALNKANKGLMGWIANVEHAGIHFLTTQFVFLAAVIGKLVPGFHPNVRWTTLVVVWVAVTHAFIDRRWPVLWWMRHTGSEEFIGHGGAAHVDQVAHIAVGLLPAALIIANL